MKNDYLSSEKELLEYKEYTKGLILDLGTGLILVLENINTTYGRNVLTAKSKSILTIFH